MKRPILYWVILFILGEVFSRIISSGVVSIIGGVLLLVCMIWNRRLRKVNAMYWIGIAFFLLGVFCMHAWEEMHTFSQIPVGEPVTFQGVLLKKEEKSRYVVYDIRITELNQCRSSFLIQVEIEPSADIGEQLILGSKVQGQGRVKELLKATNPGAFDAKSYQMGNGVLLTLEDVSYEIINSPVLKWREYLYQFRSNIADIFAELLNEADASLATAMVLGDKSGLDSEIKELYQRNGIAHLIAISGLHIAMIGGSLYRLLRRLTGSYPLAACVGIVFILGYGVMTGLSGATVRAVIMLITSMGADVFGRRYDGLSAIALALWVMLISNPYQITQVGFLLSFGAVIGIALIQPIWKIYFPKLPKWSDGFFVSISVQLVLTPIMLHFFYEIPIYSIVINVIVVPIMNWLLVALLLCGGIGVFSTEIAQLPARVADFIFSLYESICKTSELLPGHTLCTGNVEVGWIVFYYMLLALAIWLFYHRKERTAFVVCTAFLVWFAVLFLPSKLTICMFDVGQGDGIYIRTPNRVHILVDGGSSTKNKVGQYVLKNGLKYYGAATVDYVFISHSDSDHYSGVKELLEEECIRIRHVVLPAITNPDTSYMELVRLAKKKRCTIFYMKRGDVLQTDGVIFRCLGPLQQDYEDKNAGSIVLQMNYGNFDMLFTGDLTAEEEKKTLEHIEGRIEVLKVAHHGSATSSSSTFLEGVRPIIACVSVGADNSYGHPAKEVMKRLEQTTEKIYLTKNCGAITIETDGKEYVIHTFLK